MCMCICVSLVFLIRRPLPPAPPRQRQAATPPCAPCLTSSRCPTAPETLRPELEAIARDAGDPRLSLRRHHQRRAGPGAGGSGCHGPGRRGLLRRRQGRPVLRSRCAGPWNWPRRWTSPLWPTARMSHCFTRAGASTTAPMPGAHGLTGNAPESEWRQVERDLRAGGGDRLPLPRLPHLHQGERGPDPRRPRPRACPSPARPGPTT